MWWSHVSEFNSGPAWCAQRSWIWSADQITAGTWSWDPSAWADRVSPVDEFCLPTWQVAVGCTPRWKWGVFAHYIKTLYEISIVVFLISAGFFYKTKLVPPSLRSRSRSDPTLVMTDRSFAHRGIFLSYRLWSKSQFLFVKCCHLSYATNSRFIFSYAKFRL